MLMKKTKKSKKLSLKSPIEEVKKTDETVEIFNVPIYGTQRSRVLKKIFLQRKEMLHVATVNPEYIMEARINDRFKSILSQCLTVADGHGVVWAAQILGKRSEELGIGGLERISGMELVEEILKRANERGESLFLLGGAHGVAEKAASAMSKIYPKVKIATFSGAKTVAVEKSEEASMTIAKINSVSPDYLLVAYGSPYQDLWIEENRPYLRVRVAMGVGGALDEWAGVVKPCPMILDRIGLKWVWRVVHEPWRARRIIRVLHFGLLVLYHKLID
jgi:N-acetylglucosaminyldiphosphoundecaprenol N-acetyl-beta-D-mannosaminyltransferase